MTARVLVHRNYLTVDDCFVRETIECSRDGRESVAEFLSFARRQMRSAVAS
jgi:hypothetical protein